MTIKNIFYITAISVVSILSLQSCESFTDIDQKGKNLLSKTSDLELLLNYNYYLDYADMSTVSGDLINAFDCGYIPSELTNTVKTSSAILISLDESAHASVLPQINSGDSYYKNCYSVIGRIANPILSLVDAAEGSEEHKNRLRAEAYAMRAYFHYFAAQKYARVYNPSTASTELCVSYVTEDMDIQTPTQQQTQKDVYDHIISDLDNAIALDALPEVAVNRMRFCAAMPYAVKAQVLMTIGDINGAEAAAKEALKHGDVINDYGTYIVDDLSYDGYPIKLFVPGSPMNMEENYFASASQVVFKLITPFCESMQEDGSYIKDCFISSVTRSRGKYDKEDLENDRLQILQYNEVNYGVPYNVAMDMTSNHNQIGIKTSHMYLILAECAIERDRIDEAMGYLDKIRKNRIAPEYYHDLKGTVSTKADAIRWLKMACHGEYCYSIWNFITRKRWSKHDDYKETFTRTLCGNTYVLTPESDMWVFPFPISIIAQNHNLKHNYNTAL
ncbi:RagB/SusD family nutrient uptake outer membrane protein [Duncaniella muricolitica]|jgi:hypothetical protein|uniref:RagB/SusD family nutrient uptake outer membrane protein n=1 Tax=Duncaniella muricolitica TaxID=2880704 RepID=UPI00244DF544|nr:RagB/SusD family nutrient uptake outer membrane protein [Duncaniella muricolitica]